VSGEELETRPSVRVDEVDLERSRAVDRDEQYGEIEQPGSDQEQRDQPAERR
jgi:hypothetical protein